jgi:hypothetical protein
MKNDILFVIGGMIFFLSMHYVAGYVYNGFQVVGFGFLFGAVVIDILLWLGIISTLIGIYLRLKS